MNVQKSQKMEKEYFSNWNDSKRSRNGWEWIHGRAQDRLDLIFFIWLKLRSPVQLDNLSLVV